MIPNLLLTAAWLALAIALLAVNTRVGRQPARALSFYGMWLALSFAAALLTSSSIGLLRS